MSPRSPFRGRAPGTRVMRRDGQKLRLESVAAEFALLAQRRARMVRQIALLETQHVAAGQRLGVIERRMAVLSRQMVAVEPALAPQAASLSALPPLPQIATAPVAAPAPVAARPSATTRPYARKYEHPSRARPATVLEY